MQSLQCHLMMKFGKHHHCELVQMYVCVLWQPRTLPKPMELMFFSEHQMSFSLENGFKSQSLSCREEPVTCHPNPNINVLKPV